MGYVSLHTHSEYSLLDGASQLPDLIEQAKKLNMPAIALTDHGVMYGAIELIKRCRNIGMKPIVGVEAYVINGDVRDKKARLPRYHQILLAKNYQGYKNLVKLVTISHLEGSYYKPRINKELLEQYHEGLIVTSACLGGEIPQAILQGKVERAYEVAVWYKRVFGDDFYLEIQDHGSREDRAVNPEIVRIAQKYKIKIVATNDSHFTCMDDVDAHDALLCIQTGKSIEEENRLRYTGTEYLKSRTEMAGMFRDHLPLEIVEEALENTLEIADKVEKYDQELLGGMRMPDFPIPQGHTAETYLEELTWEGLRERFKEIKIVDPEEKVPYEERLRYELKMMQQMGFSTYFLVVWDYIKYASDHGIPVGPGRGSAAGSLVAYALRITNMDPVRYNLLFERFLNPERKSMPDIDTDFCIERRGEIIEYVTKRYGEDHVAQIITFNRLASKAVLKDVARVMEIPYSESDRMAKMIPVFRGKPAKLDKMISEDTPAPEFKEAYDKDPRVKKWVDLARRLENTNKTFGVHAAGVVISREPLDEIVPLQKNNEGQVITQYYMEDIADLGLLKMDFLGLRNLTMIQRALEIIEAKNKEVIDLDTLALDDEKTYALLAKGELEGIFQLESSGMKQIVKDLRPSNIEDISAILALYRPGPLDAGMIPDFINRKHGRQKIQYDDPLLEPILKDTYGTILYQEQIMKIAQDLGGYSLGQADLLRRAMGKKKGSEMEKHREQFVDGATRNGVNAKTATNLFEQMVMFAEYCFNKAHSAAYGLITYQTAYLKANYPVEYLAALLSSVRGDQDKVQRYLAACQVMGIYVLPPDINRSGPDFTPEGKTILFGLAAVKNAGDAAVESLLKVRDQGGPFTSLADICDRIDSRVVNKRALEALIRCGALDTLHSNRNQMLCDLELILEWSIRRARDRASGQVNLFDSLLSGTSTAEQMFDSAPKGPIVEDLLPQDKLKMEKELLGFYVSDHPLKSIREVARILAPINLIDLPDYREEASVSAIILVTEMKVVTTKKGDRMAILQVEDLTGSASAILFPKAYERLNECFKPDARLMIWAKVDRKDDQPQLILNDAEPIEDVRMILVELSPNQAREIQVQHRLRELLGSQAPEKKEELGLVPVIARIDFGQEHRFVRFGPQFRVKNADATVTLLNQSGFSAQAQAVVPAVG